jgi:hypothetical protein
MINPLLKGLVLPTWPLGGYTHNVTVHGVRTPEDNLKICRRFAEDLLKHGV